MEAIEQFEIVEDTILVFTSDHGEMFGSHGRRTRKIFDEEACRILFLNNRYLPKHTRHNVDDPISNKFFPSLQEQKAIT